MVGKILTIRKEANMIISMKNDIGSLEKINDYYIKHCPIYAVFIGGFPHKLYIDIGGCAYEKTVEDYFSGGIIFNSPIQYYLDRQSVFEWVKTVLGDQYVKDYQDNVDFSVRKIYENNEYVFDYDSKKRIISVHADVFHGKKDFMNRLDKLYKNRMDRNSR